MLRALLELAFTIFIIIVARAILTSIVRGFVNAGRPSAPQSNSPATGELHKDPVCGTYVAESTPFRSQISGSAFYYCSSDCKEKHTLVAK